MSPVRLSRRRGVTSIIISMLVCFAVVLVLVLPGCGPKGPEEKKKEYRTEWERIMQAFQKQVEEDDRKADELVKQKDVAGVVRFVRQRLKRMKETETEILDLYPPDDLRRLHAMTLYYLEALLAQLEAQNELNEAALEGLPTTDLAAKVEALANKTRQITNELAIEVQLRGLSVTPTTPGEPEESEKEEGQSEDNESKESSD